MTIAKRGPGRPLDMDLRDRIEAVHRDHPTWSQRQVAAELVKLADSYAEDDGNGETYCREAMKRLLESWGHVRDE